MATLLQSTTIGGHSAIHAGNIGSQSVNYANSAGSTAWTNVSGRPTALSQFTNDLGNYGNWITSAALANYLTTSQVTSSMISGLNNMLGVTSLPYSVDITVGGDPDRFYAVQFWGGDQDVWRRIIIKRGYSEPAPWDPIGTGVHHGGLLLDWEGNFGGWGGAEYADRLRVFNESYTNVCADMFIWSHSMGYVFMLRGGGALYHIHSDQAINGYYQAGSPDILYSSSTLSYDDNWSGTNVYDVYAPAPLGLAAVNSTRIDGLRTKKQSLLDGRYQQISTAITTSNIGSQSVNYASSAGSVAWTNVSSRPTALSQFTNDLVISTTDNTKLPLAGGTMSGRLTLKSISGVEQTVPNDFGAYLHLGDWGVGRTATGAVLVNTAYRADYATDLFDMNISRFTNNSGYITGYTETDTFQSVTNRGASTSAQVSFTKTDDHAISVGTIRGRAVGSQTGEFIQLYERVNIGGPNGWGAANTAAPSYGLSVYGGANIGYGNSASLFAYAYRGNSNVSGTGEASYHPAGIYSTGTNWLYGTMYVNGNHINDVGYLGVGQSVNTNYRIITSGDYYANAGGNFWAEGRFKQYRGSGTWHDVIDSGNIGSQSVASATRTSGNSGYAHPGTGMWPFFNWGGSNGGGSAPNDSSYTTGISVGSHPGDQAYGFQIANNMWNTGLWTRNYNSGFGSWIRLIDSDIIGSQSVNYATSSGNSATTSQRSFNYLYASSYLESGGAVYGTIFYDNDDRAYYLNPNGGSRLRNLYVGDSGDDWSDPGGWGTQVRFSNGPHVKFVLHARTPGIEAGMYVHTPGSVFMGSYTAHVLSLMYAGNMRMQVEDSRIYSNVYMESASSMRAPIFYDSNDTAFYLDPNGTSNLNKFSERTMAYNGMNPMSANSPYVDRYNASAGYRNGTMGYSRIDFNIIARNWGSGFIDTWSSPENAPGGSSHYVGLQGVHYSDGASTFYGFQMACAGEADNRFFWRSSWPSMRNWVEMIHSGNIGSQSVNYASSAGSANSVAWSNVSSRPTALSQFSNDLGNYGGFLTSLPSHTHDDRYFFDYGFTTGYPGTEASGMPSNRSAFTYSNGAPLTGCIAHFGAAGYGIQLNGDYGGDSFSMRSRNGDNGTWRPWKRLLTDYNYNSYSPTLTGGGASGTWGINITGNADTVDGYHESSFFRDNQDRTLSVLRFTGVGGDSGNENHGYAIYQGRGSWSWPYPDLHIGYHTGIKIGANYSYNGTRFYNDSNMETITFSVNDGDNNARGYYDIIAYASDRRLKHNVKPIENALSKVMSLVGMTYEWNSVGNEYGWTPSTEREAGVFAQDVQAVLPEAVKIAPFDQGLDENGEMFSKSGENFLTVKYEKIVPLLIEAIKEQQKEIDELKAKLN